jgi:hypothetical protein
MTDKDIDTMLDRARGIATELAEGGWNANAEVIRSLVRSRIAARETNRRMKQDNDALRRAVDPYMLTVSGDFAVCIGGRWDGWLFQRHPDGQWVSQRKLERVTGLAVLERAQA